MNETLCFRPIEEAEVPDFFQIILDRMAWMDQKGIRQWNVTDYAAVYPREYYEAHRQAGQLYVLVDSQNVILAGAVFLESDPRWNRSEPALYLHNFATRVGQKGIGPVFLAHAEALCRQKGKLYFRLDSADDNPALTRYYTSLGFVPVGSCVDGLYTGILREKRL